MKASVVQSLLAQNKKHLSVVNLEISEAKEQAKFLFSIDHDYGADSFLKYKSKLEKKREKLEVVQKELKKELQLAYRLERAERLSKLVPNIFWVMEVYE